MTSDALQPDSAPADPAKPQAPAAPAPDLRGSLAALLIPLAVSAVLLALVLFIWGGSVAVEIVVTSVATGTVAGKFIVARGLNDSGFFDSPWKLVPLVVYLDCIVAVIAVYNMGILFRIPRFGRKLADLQQVGVRMLERNPWMRKMTFIGVIAFVMFPLSGTGAIGGAFFGRLLGMSRNRTFTGIAIGTVLGGSGMAALAVAMGTSFTKLKDDPLLLAGGVVVIALLVWWLFRRAKTAQRLPHAE